MKSRRLTDALSRDLRSSGLVSRFLAMSPSLRLPQHARNLVTCLPGTLPPWHKGGKRYPVIDEPALLALLRQAVGEFDGGLGNSMGSDSIDGVQRWRRLRHSVNAAEVSSQGWEHPDL